MRWCSARISSWLRPPSAVIVATLEDALAVAERPNMPNTTAEWPNWSLALPCPLEAIESHPLVRAVATALQGVKSQQRSKEGLAAFSLSLAQNKTG